MTSIGGWKDEEDKTKESERRKEENKIKKKLNQRQEMEGFKYSGEKESLLLWWCKVTNV